MGRQRHLPEVDGRRCGKEGAGQMKEIISWLAIPLVAILAIAGITLSSTAAMRAPRFTPIAFAEQATVLVSDDTGHGSGTVIAPGVVLTAGHVVGDRRSMKI